MMKKLLIKILILSIALTSCMKDEEYWEQFRPEIIESPEGVFIINEGNLGYNNASLSYYDIESQTVYKNVFRETNSAFLGDVAQSMQIRDSLAYVVINNSGKILVIDKNTFQLRGKITGLESPRYIHFLSDSKAYVSDLYGRVIHIVNPQSMQKTGEIDLGDPSSPIPQHNADRMLQYGTRFFTTCWNFDDMLLVVDTETDMPVDSLKVPLQPNSMVLDKEEKLWVLCDGGYAGNALGHEKPALLRIDPVSMEVMKTFRFELEESPTELTANNAGDTLYFIKRHIYRHAISSGSVPEIFIESPYQGGIDGGFYGLAVDPATSEVYVSDAIDMVQPGVVYRFNPAGMPIDTVKAGIIPGAFCFKRE